MSECNIPLAEMELSEMLEELNTVPAAELCEAMTECFKSLTIDPTEKPGPIISIMTTMDLLIKAWSKHTKSNNAELRDSSQRLVNVLKQIKRENNL